MSIKTQIFRHKFISGNDSEHFLELIAYKLVDEHDLNGDNDAVIIEQISSEHEPISILVSMEDLTEILTRAGG